MMLDNLARVVLALAGLGILGAFVFVAWAAPWPIKLVIAFGVAVLWAMIRLEDS